MRFADVTQQPDSWFVTHVWRNAPVEAAIWSNPSAWRCPCVPLSVFIFYWEGEGVDWMVCQYSLLNSFQAHTVWPVSGTNSTPHPPHCPPQTHHLIPSILSLQSSHFISSSIETFRRSYRDPPSRTYPSGTDPPNPSARTWFGPDFDPISTWFGPEKGDFRSKSGRNWVKIGSKAGPGGGVRWVGAGGVGPAGGVPVAPPESLYSSKGKLAMLSWFWRGGGGCCGYLSPCNTEELLVLYAFCHVDGPGTLWDDHAQEREPTQTASVQAHLVIVTKELRCPAGNSNACKMQQ